MTTTKAVDGVTTMENATSGDIASNAASQSQVIQLIAELQLGKATL